MTMRHSNIANPMELAALTKAIAAHCERFGIVDALSRETVALRAFNIFQTGVSRAEDIEARLAEIAA